MMTAWPRSNYAAIHPSGDERIFDPIGTEVLA